MRNAASVLHWLWSGLLRWIARNRAVALALLSAFASVLIGLAVTWKDASQVASTSSGGGLSPLVTIIVVAGAVLLMLLAGAVPPEYAAAERFDYLLPVMHHVLGLTKGDRMAVHRLHRFPSLGYEQITDYYDGPPTKRARESQGEPDDQKPLKHSVGRRFSISHGIVAQSLSHPGHPIAWAVPSDQKFSEAMIDRWFFTEEEAARITPDRRSFLAFPIGRDGEYAKAVLYADSANAATFGEPAGKEAIARINDLFEGALNNALKG